MTESLQMGSSFTGLELARVSCGRIGQSSWGRWYIGWTSNLTLCRDDCNGSRAIPCLPSCDQCVTVHEGCLSRRATLQRALLSTILGVRWLAGQSGPPPAEPRNNWFRSSVGSNQELPSKPIEALACALLERGVEGRVLAVVPTREVPC